MTKTELLEQYINDLKMHILESPGRDNRIAELEEELELNHLQNTSYNSDYAKCTAEVLDYISYSINSKAGRDIRDIIKKHFA